MDSEDLRLRIWQQATCYKTLNGIQKLDADLACTKAIVETVIAGLKSTFQVSGVQAVSGCSVGCHKVYG